MSILVLGLNHKTAPVEIREKLNFTKNRIAQKSREIKELEYVDGLVILSTCNRTEFYINSPQPSAAKKSLLDFAAAYSGFPVEALEKHLYWKEMRQAVHHLFRVTAGLDSMIIGESQILGQVEEAYNYARDYRLSDNILNPLFQKAIEVGKRVRTETRIDRQALSVGSAAVELAREVFGSLDKKTVLVLGAGETGELAARHLVANGVTTVIVANRTFPKAVQLASELQGEAVLLEKFPDYLPQADIIISCTAAPHYIIKPADLRPVWDKRGNKPLLLIDIAVPRDIHPAVRDLENVILYDVDDLQDVVQKNLESRRKEAVSAELLVTEELNKFFAWYDSLFVIPAIVALKEKGEMIKELEVRKVFNKLPHLTKREKEIIAALAGSIVNKLLYDPIDNLKRSAQTEKGLIYMEAMKKLFNLEIDSPKQSCRQSLRQNCRQSLDQPREGAV